VFNNWSNNVCNMEKIDSIVIFLEKSVGKNKIDIFKVTHQNNQNVFQ